MQEFVEEVHVERVSGLCCVVGSGGGGGAASGPALLTARPVKRSAHHRGLAGHANIAGPLHNNVHLANSFHTPP